MLNFAENRKMKRPEAVKLILATIRKVAPKAEVVLYGSEARGDAREDSDFDVLILEDSEQISYERRKEIEGPLYNLYLEKGIDVSPMLMTRSQWYDRPFLTPFFINVTNEGVRL